MPHNFNVSPYFDDFNESKQFDKILFKPALAVQARELTQLQTILQKQIQRHGEFVFKNGSPVVGGETSINLKLDYVKLELNFDGVAITASNYLDKILVGAVSGAKARVLNTLGPDATTSDPNTLFVSYLTGDSVTDGVVSVNVTTPGTGYTSAPTVTFTGAGYGAAGTAVINAANQVVAVIMTAPGSGYTSVPTVGFTGGGGSSAAATANINTSSVFTSGEQLDHDVATALHADVMTSGVGLGSSVSIQQGVFFVNGKFSVALSQELILDKYSNTPTYRIGIEELETVITSSDDNTLLDPASGSFNFNAPGADRLKVDVVLAKKDFSSIDDETFFELLKIEAGVLKKKVIYPLLSELNKTLARRTFDESGSYTVRDFPISIKPHASDNTKFITQLDSGKAFIKGFEHQTIAPTDIVIDKARDYVQVDDFKVSTIYGNYVVVDTMKGPFNIDTMESIDLHDQKETIEISSVQTDGVATISTGTFYSALSDFVTDGVAAGHRLYITAGADSAGGTGGAPASPAAPAAINLLDFGSFTTPGTNNIDLGTFTTPSTYVNDLGIFPINLLDFGSFTTPSTNNIDLGTFTTPSTYNNDLGIFPINLLDFGSFTAPATNNIDLGTFTAPSTYNNDLGTFTAPASTSAGAGGSGGAGEAAGPGTGIYTVVSVTNSNTLVVTPVFASGGTGQTFTVQGGIIKDDSPNYETSKIGTANVRQIKYQSGTGAGPYIYRLYIFNINISASNLFKDLESVFVGPWNNTNPGAANVETLLGKAGATAGGDALLISNAFNTLVFPIAQSNIKSVKALGGSSDTDYQYQKVFSNVVFSGGTATISTGDAAKDFIGPQNNIDLIDDLKTANYHAVITTTGTGFATLGEVVEFTTASRTIKVQAGGGSVIFDTMAGSFAGQMQITATINVDNSIQKSKTLVKNNTVAIGSPGAQHAYDTLAISDVNTIKAVYENTSVPPRFVIGAITGGPFVVGEVITQAGQTGIGELIQATASTSLDIIVTSGTFTSAAVLTGGTSGATATSSSWTDRTNIISEYILDSGQKDNFYDHGRMQRTAAGSPTGEILAVVDYFTHGGGNGFFSVDSYSIPYEEIPKFQSPTTGTNYSLRDVLDFRPRRQDGGTAYEGGQIPIPTTSVDADYSYYLSRIDKIYIDSVGKFGVIEGISALSPVDPPDLDDTITLYVLRIPAFTFNNKDVIVTQIKNKRFTMKDIGRIERRVERVEYYTALSMLENETKSLLIEDINGLDRFKNGILIDPFTGHNIGDVLNPDYRCSVDFNRGELRSPFNTDDFNLSYDAGSSTGITKTGDLLTLPFTTELLVDQNVASSFINVNPFNIVSWVGNLTITPSNDTWVDTTTRPDILVNLEGEKDAWAFMSDLTIETQWEDWNTLWSGTELINSQTSISTQRNFNNDGRAPWLGIPENWWNEVESRVTRSTFETSERQIRTGISTSIVPESITRELGDRIVDVSIIPFIRATTLTINANSLKPNSQLYPFFDGVDVSAFCTPAGGSLGGAIYTDSAGSITNLSFALPNSDAQRFKTGERVFRLIDNSNNLQTASSTLAEDKFFAQGLLQTKENTIISTRVPTIQRLSVTENRTVTNVFDRTESEESELRRWFDPIAETFLIDAQIYPNGLFLSSIDCFFKDKDPSLPITLQLREVINGFPSQKIIPLSTVTLQPASVNISANATVSTAFVFESPVYLQGGEYAFVLLTNSNQYTSYIAEMGENILGTSRKISKQPYAGSFFKSQNASTWSPDQNIDIMFKMNKCVFTTAGTHEALFNNVSVSPTKNYDLMYWQSRNLVFNNTSLVFYKKTTVVGGALDTAFSRIFPNTNHQFKTQQEVSTTLGSFVGKVTFTSTDVNISPVIDLVLNNVLAIENIINNVNTNEDGTTGGDATARYITRRVSLASGFDSTDLKVLLTANKPIESQIYVYYKVLSASDSDNFDDKNYVLMQQVTEGSIVADTETEFTEYEYAPVTSPITYGNHNSFITFSIKIVMTSSNTSIVPKIKDLRVISLL